MNFLNFEVSSGHISEAIVHINQARDNHAINRLVVDVARIYFDGLNKLQTEWVLKQQENDVSEIKAFQSMILQGLRSEVRRDFLQSSELRSLVFLEPQIMNHDVLRRRNYSPSNGIEPSLFRDASETHRKLANAYSAKDGTNDVIETEARVLKRAAELLYIVRSNIAHGEKTPYGPDLEKKERDKNVCSVIVPLQERYCLTYCLIIQVKGS